MSSSLMFLMSVVAGYSGVVEASPNSRMAGISTNEARTPPAAIVAEICVPMM